MSSAYQTNDYDDDDDDDNNNNYNINYNFYVLKVFSHEFPKESLQDAACLQECIVIHFNTGYLRRFSFWNQNVLYVM